MNNKFIWPIVISLLFLAIVLLTILVKTEISGLSETKTGPVQTVLSPKDTTGMPIDPHFRIADTKVGDFSETATVLRPKEVISIPINPPFRASDTEPAFQFSAVKIYEFPSGGSILAENCLAMREWLGNKTYFSCGQVGQKVIILEGSYKNDYVVPVFVVGHKFRIRYDQKYIEANFTTADTITIDPDVEYIFRVAFEKIENVPNVFTIESADEGVYNKYLEIDLKGGTATFFEG
ncbi:MAG: hypothetical protein Q7S52_00695 [bacterium]|nr:hypothetical protein [bacterium]